jgi:hypothetical protein
MCLLNSSKANYKQARAKKEMEHIHGQKQKTKQTNFCHLRNINNYIITTMLIIMQWEKEYLYIYSSWIQLTESVIVKYEYD